MTANKQPVLSTDGHQLLNGLSQDITPPGGLGGENNSTQSSLIIPVPGDETLYYIFATGKSSESGSEIRYALFDRKLNDGQGGLIASNLLLFSNSTGRITGNGEWLIAHELGNNSFRAYRVTPSGISDAVVSPIGSIVNENESHYMKLGGDNKLGVAISAGNAGNWIEVFDFDAFSGKITNKRIGDLGVSSGQINGIEFFAGGNKIFATWSDGETSRIYEFAPHVPYRYHQLQWKDYEGEFGMIQNAPDGKLYVAVNGSTTIRRFAAAPDTAVVTNIVLEDFELAWTTASTRGLPNTIIAPPLAMNFSVVNACAGQLTGFLATGKEPSIDKFDWSFGDGQSEIDAHPSISHLYTAAGNYTVVLTIRNKCQSPVTSITREITLSHPPPDPSTTVALCADPVILDANPQDIPDLTFAWSNTHTSETMEVNQPGSYVVVISTEFGCSTEATFIVADNTPFVNLGEDKSFCKGASVVLDAMNPGASYSWSVDGQPNGNGLRTQAVNTSASGVFIYSVKVTDPVTTCVGSDAVTYTIRDTPEFMLSSSSPIACNTASGQITISVLSPTTLFDYSVVGPGGTFSNTGDASNGPAFTPASLAEGTYSVTVTDQQSGCQNVDEINVDAALERPAISVDGDLLTSSSDDSNQWFKDGIRIAGATGRTYHATQSGVYAVQVRIGECSALSLPVTVTITGLGEARLADMKVFPNPFRNTITIQLHESAVGAVVELFTVEGIRMQTVEVAMGERSISGEIDLVNYPSAIYILKVRLATGYKVVKLTKL